MYPKQQKLPEAGSNERINGKLFLTGIASLALVFYAYPLLSAFGANHMNIFSVLEFYLIDLTTVPLRVGKRRNKRFSKKINRWLPFVSPALSGIANFTLFGAILPASFGSVSEGIGSFILDSGERLDAVLGDLFDYMWTETKSLLGFLNPFGLKMYLFIPLVAAVMLSPLNVILLPFKLSVFALTLGVTFGGSVVASFLLNSPVYRYIRIDALAFSIALSVLQDTAFNVLHSSYGGIMMAGGFYALTLLPLIFFAGRAYYAKVDENSSFLTKLGRFVGVVSILLHGYESLGNLCGVFGYTFGIERYNHFAKMAQFIGSEYFQTRLLTATTAVAGLCVAENLDKNEASLVAATAA